jgi:2-polyprenyl-3-methyl-5-hydroxy-6-metoxy-1,4-benzoquinol methylase
MEPFYPLHVYVCENCYLVQLQEFEAPNNIFSQYAYFSSYSETWLEHARIYTQLMIERFGLDSDSEVIELGSNDGYLLQYFREMNIPVLGIEPAKNVAKVAEAAGIPTIVTFFGSEVATRLRSEGRQADLLVGNNVLAHVPKLNDFVEGMRILLKPQGLITMEFPHLMRLIAEKQFDTIYHEHFSYFSFINVKKVFAEWGLIIFDVEELPTHGGSLRIYARNAADNTKAVSQRVLDLLEREVDAGFTELSYYLSFGDRVKKTKRNILDFMIRAKEKNETIVGYGAPAKGNTLLNYCGISTDFIEYTVDLNPYKQGRFLPGSHIPIYSPEKVVETKPDYLLILPWNLKDEIIQQMYFVRDWGCKFLLLIPQVEVVG